MPTKGKDAPTKPAPDPAKPKPAEPKRRPSEPNLAVMVMPERPKTRPSEPNLAVMVKPNTTAPKQRPSEPNLAVAKSAAVAPKAVAKARPSELAIPAKPAKKPEPKPSTKGELPGEWKALLGKPLTCSWRRSTGHMIEVIDWAKFPDRGTWLEDVFGDSDPGKHFTGLLARKPDHLEWTSPVMLPVALLGQQHGGEGQLEAILLIDTTTADSPIFAIEVDGTAIPAKKPQQIAANLAALKIEVQKPDSKAKASTVDFDTARPKVASKKIDGDARKILQKLSGDRDAGSAYLQAHVEKKPKPPEGRDPRWIEALRDELAKSIVLASDGYQSETHFFAGTLASFGEPAIPALVAALEIALKSYPKHSLDYGVQPVLLALDYLHSDAGVAPALVLLEKAKTPEKSYAIPPVLDYLKTRTADPRVAPVLKKFYKKVASKKPMHYIGDLDAIAKQLDI